MVVEMVVVWLIPFGAVTDIALATGRHLQYGRENLAGLALQMHFVADVAVVVAPDERVVDMVDDR